MAPITTPKPGHVPRVRRAALWFNHIWPGSLTEENNLVWRTHGPLGRGRWRWQTTFVRAWMLAGMFPAGSTPGHFGGVCRRRRVVGAWLPLGLGAEAIPTRIGRERRRLQYGAMAAILVGVAAVAAPSSIGHHNGALDGLRVALLRGLGVGSEAVPESLSRTQQVAQNTRSHPGHNSLGGGPAMGIGPLGGLSPNPDLAGSEDFATLGPATPDGAIPYSPTLLGGDGPQDGLTILDSDFGGALGGGPGGGGGTGGAGGGGSGGGGSGGGGGPGGGSGGAGGAGAGGGGGTGGGGAGAGGTGGSGATGGSGGGGPQVFAISTLPDDFATGGAGGTGGGGFGGTGGSGGGSGTGGSGGGSGGSVGGFGGGSGGGGFGGGGSSGGQGGGGGTGGGGGSGGGPTAPVPEPAIWMTLISGFGVMGALLRRRYGTRSAA